MLTETTISILAELPEGLHNRISAFVAANNDWSYDDFLITSTASLLMQLGDSNSRDARIYLDQMFVKRLGGKAA